MDFNELVKKARTTRRFKEDEPISEEDMMKIMKILRVIPCGGNAQPLKYRIVLEKDERDKFFPLVRWAAAMKDWNGPEEGERPTGYIVICSKKDKNPATDIGIAGMTAQLAAADLGYGACMMGSIDREEIFQLLQIPDDLQVNLVIAFGRPGEKIVVEDMPDDGSVDYWRDEDGVHHLPKRSLDDIIIEK